MHIEVEDPAGGLWSKVNGTLGPSVVEHIVAYELSPAGVPPRELQHEKMEGKGPAESGTRYQMVSWRVEKVAPQSRRHLRRAVTLNPFICV